MNPLTRAQRANKLDCVGFSFTESMSGCIVPGETDPRRALTACRCPDNAVTFDVRVGIGDLGRFVRDPQHRAGLTGTISLACPTCTLEIRDGRLELFSVNPRTGARQIAYSFRFTTDDGQIYFFRGCKEIRHDPWRFDLLNGMTRLFATVYRGEDDHAPVHGSGVLRFRLRDVPAWLGSMQADGPAARGRQLAARAAFLSLSWAALRNEYLHGIRFFYETQYENLILAGRLRRAHSDSCPSFFFASGTHGKGFPWGDREPFWDALLVISDEGGGCRKFCISERVLPGLDLDLVAGTYRYAGPIFQMSDGSLRMEADSAQTGELRAEIQVDFESGAFESVSFPFPRASPWLRGISSGLTNWLWSTLPGTNPPGIHIRPHAVRIRSGSVRIVRTADAAVLEDWTVDTGSTWGEGERGTFRNIKRPKLGYRYRCAIDPDRKSARVHIVAGTLRSRGARGDLLDHLVKRFGSAEIVLDDCGLRVERLSDASVETAASLLEVTSSQFPTAVFQRRIVEACDASGARHLALEEGMSSMRLEPINSDRKVTVASIQDHDKYRALDRVLEASEFDRILEDRLRDSGKPRAWFLIVIKPNFMFAYHRRDPSTYTDPELVHHLVRRLRNRGFSQIRIVESQSTYGEYFDERSVREMAEYLGYDGSPGYEVVDLTLDAKERRKFGPALGCHPVPGTWRSADFRISFAKNKTHPYAHYTLNLKNIYGALPLANKFREYHCARDIYRTTIEYLAAFPVHFGLIDAYVSADGPFGVFANPKPNRTETILGGSDLVAVDWVGASKMGLDPMKSKHMRLAVQQFGKPEIRLIGDAHPYPAWRKMPDFLTVLTHKGVDSSYRIGNLLYAISAQADEAHFHLRNKAWYMRLLRAGTMPVRHFLFVHTNSGDDPNARGRQNEKSAAG